MDQNIFLVLPLLEFTSSDCDNKCLNLYVNVIIITQKSKLFFHQKKINLSRSTDRSFKISPIFWIFFPGRQYYDHILNIFIVGILLHSLQPFVNPCYTWVHLSQNKYVEISTMENLNKYLATKISIESPKWESLFIFWSMVMHMFKKLICRVRNFHSVYNCQVQAQIEPKI